MTLPGYPRPPHPYARRHLAAHAAAAGALDDVLSLETLPYLDETRLSTLLRLTEPPPLSSEWFLRNAWRSIRHRWSWDDPDANAAALDVALLAVDPEASVYDRWTASGVAWRPRLVQWQSGETIVAGDQHRGYVGLAVGAALGIPLLVTADLWSVRLWDPATGQPIGEQLFAPAEIKAVALAEGPGLVLAACGGGQVVVWDAITHLLAGTIETADPEPTALAVGAIANRWVVAVGGPSGIVQLREIRGGALVREIREDMSVRGLALAGAPGERLYLAIGYADYDKSRILVYDALSGAPRHNGIAINGEVTTVGLAKLSPSRRRSAQTEREFIVAAGTTRGTVDIWDALDGSHLRSMNYSGGEVRSLALASIPGMDLLAVGGSDRAVWIWEALSGNLPNSPRLQPAPVTTVAFGDVEGRTMLVAGGLDGNVRLWDPLESSATRVSVDGWFPSVALDDDAVAAGGEDGRIRVWNLGYGAEFSYLPPPLETGSQGVYSSPSIIKLRLGGSRTRTLVTQYADGVRVWDLSDPSILALRTEASFPDLRAIDVHAGSDSGQVLVAGLDYEERVSVIDVLADTTPFAKRVNGADSVKFIDAAGPPLLAVGARGQLHVLDASFDKGIRVVLPAPPPEHAAVGNLDGADVLAALYSDGLRLFDLGTGEQTIPRIEMSTTASGVAWGRVEDRDVVVTAHFATVRVWNPRTGRKITELRLGTRIGGMSVRGTRGGGLMVAISGPGLVLTELRAISPQTDIWDSDKLPQNTKPSVNRQWYGFPSLVLQLKALSIVCNDLREHNLFEGDGIRPKEDLGEPTEEVKRARTPDGTWNDLSDPWMGSRGSGFGRNVPLSETVTDTKRLLDPDPRVISRRLMARDEFKPAGIINALAAAWLQFENHNWFFHGDGVADKTIDIGLRKGDDFPEDPMRIRCTIPIHGEIVDACPAPVFGNVETHWWDGSQIYGSGKERQAEVRTFVDGKVKVGDDGRLPKSDIPGVDLTGMRENWWVGVGLLHTLFAREHNSVCDALKKAYPSLDDQRLFELGVLVVSALIAKIHTVEWTTCVLRHPALQICMNANWYGALGERFKDRIGRIGDSEVLSGIIGSPADHHSSPFSLTEEFVSIYRMHPLIPDDWNFFSLESGEHLESRDFTELQGRYTRDFMDRMEMGDMWYSMGLASAGAVCLHNYPNALRQLTRIDGQVTDLATLDIVRDRERGVPRYNDFREALRMPRRRSIDEITPNKVWAKEINEVYNGDVDAVDLQIGMQAEQPPKGFGFSDTAFRIFILMASRRLKSDRFFTNDFRPEVYTQVGFDWVNDTSMKEVLLRHYPELEPVIGDAERVFAPWMHLGAPSSDKKRRIVQLGDSVRAYMPWG